MRLLVQISLVALGSALGGLTRWAVAILADRLLGHSFPWGTLFINVTGSFVLGWFATLLSDWLLHSEATWVRIDDLRLLVAVGFTSSYTTFSTYEFEGHKLLRDGHSVAGIAYLVGSVCLGLLAVRLGVVLAEWK